MQLSGNDRPCTSIVAEWNWLRSRHLSKLRLLSLLTFILSQMSPRLLVMLAAASIATATAGTAAPAADQRRPNLIVIQCDDLGWDDLAVHGNPHVQTPHIDSLAAQSVQFSNFTVNPVCAPSRASFLTGRHFLRTGVSHVHGGKDYLHLSERTLADHLGAAGYATGMWGKWHSGATEGYFPWQRGFDEAWMAQLYRHRDARGQRNGSPIETSKWADAAMVDFAIDFISRQTNQPFFAYLPTMTPHAPHDAPEYWVRHYTEKGHSTALAKLWGMISFLDEQIGRLLETIEVLGLTDNTVVVFMSDNGPAIDSSSLSDADRAQRKVSGMRGWKGDLYENGVRSPLFIRWPKRLQPKTIETVRDGVDIAPTLLELAEVNALKDAHPMDGSSFAPELFGKEDDTKPSKIFNYAHRGWLTSGPPYSLDGIPGEYAPINEKQKAVLPFHSQSLSVRDGRFKLMLNPDFHASDGAHWMLVDLVADPAESRDVAADFPEVTLHLTAKMNAWWRQIRGEPHAFDSPLFQPANGRLDIPANAPCSIEGAVFNNVLGLGSWNRPGDMAAYRIELQEAAIGTINMVWRPEQPQGASWTITLVESPVSVTTDGTQAVSLLLPAGESILELRLSENNSSEPIPSLRRIQIELNAVE